MIALNLSEATVLQRFLEDPYGRSAVANFFEKQRLYHTNRATSHLLSGDTGDATKSAFFALAYETSMAELEHFVRNELQKLT